MKNLFSKNRGEVEGSLLERVLVFILVFGQIPFASYYGAWVMLSIYNWFLLPIGSFMPALQVGNMFGIIFIIGYSVSSLGVSQLKKADLYKALGKKEESNKKPWPFFWLAASMAWGIPFTTYCFGYLYHMWFMH